MVPLTLVTRLLGNPKEGVMMINFLTDLADRYMAAPDPAPEVTLYKHVSRGVERAYRAVRDLTSQGLGSMTTAD